MWKCFLWGHRELRRLGPERSFIGVLLGWRVMCERCNSMFFVTANDWEYERDRFKVLEGEGVPTTFEEVEK